MSSLRVKPIDRNAPGSFRERGRIVQALARIRSDDTDYITAQALLDELLLSRLETTNGSNLEEEVAKLTAAEADALVKDLLKAELAEVPTESAEN